MCRTLATAFALSALKLFTFPPNTGERANDRNQHSGHRYVETEDGFAIGLVRCVQSPGGFATILKSFGSLSVTSRGGFNFDAFSTRLP